MEFLVGTFNTQEIYTFRFEPPSELRILRVSQAIGSHSWLAVSRDKRFLYASAWTTPSSVVAYRVSSSGKVDLINSKGIAGRSGYVTCSQTHVYTAGGSTGEVFLINRDGGLGDLIQELSFKDTEKSETDRSCTSVPHGDFGGLRHGAHSIDLSPDEKSVYVADIGRNCVWTYSVASEMNASSHLLLGSKHISPRTNDGPRHTIPHPNGKVLYSVQEHSNMVDSFTIADDGTSLRHISGVNILPADHDPKEYWADEVRVSACGVASNPKYLYASTRGLEAHTKGYVAVFKLREDGQVGEALDIFETPTSGGLANAIEPMPFSGNMDTTEYLTLTETQEGFVFILSFNGHQIKETARVKLLEREGTITQAATAVWL